MKKTYIIPQTEEIRLSTECALLAASLNIDTEKEADQWTHKKGGWYSESWTDTDTEED
ncbi:MAG: hypothetical protein J1F06_01080 [Prevotellaceae bacterium]|nr:hypothetical protein [Prevotellaceae bacterium]